MTMTLTRWDPVRDIFSLQNQLGRFFGDSPARFQGADFAGTWNPPVDIIEEDSQIVVRAELPGVRKEDIEVNLEHGILTLRGEKKQEKKVDSENVYRVERFYGAFSRSFTLPSSIDSQSIKATYRDGVLEIVLPKAEEAKPKKIAVS